MKIQQYATGYALLGVVLLTALLSVTVIALYYRSMTVTIGAPAIVAQQQARQLALSGIECALAQLQEKPKSEQKKSSSSQESPEALPFIWCNHWQTLKIEQGEITWQIVAEDGKLNLNELFDIDANVFQHPQELSKDQPFKEKRGLYRLFLAIGKELQADRFAVTLEQFYAGRKRQRLNDLSELLSIPALQKAFQRLWPDPNQKEIALFDLCTLYSRTPSINILYLAPALCKILGLRVMQADMSRAQLQKEGLKLVRATQKVDSALWDEGIGKLYGKKYLLIEPFAKIVSIEQKPTVFGVTSIGKVQGAEQKVFAILELDRSATPQEERRFVIKKLYLASGI